MNSLIEKHVRTCEGRGQWLVVRTLLQFFAEAARLTYPNNSPAFDIMLGGTSEQFAVLLFDAAIVEYADFEGFLPQNYANGGISVTIQFSMVSDVNNSHQVVIGVAFVPDSLQDWAAAQGYNWVYGNITIQGFSKQTKQITIPITHAFMGSPAAGTRFLFRINRNASSGTDDATGDMRLHGIHIKET